MGILDIVSCWVSKDIPFEGNFEELRDSFRESGFKEVKKSNRVWLYKRGATVSATCDYNSEALQIQVYVERTSESHIQLRVGNYGFPFEPLMMKKRFLKNLERMSEEISTHGKLKVDKSEVDDVLASTKEASLDIKKAVKQLVYTVALTYALTQAIVFLIGAIK